MVLPYYLWGAANKKTIHNEDTTYATFLLFLWKLVRYQTMKQIGDGARTTTPPLFLSSARPMLSAACLILDNLTTEVLAWQMLGTCLTDALCHLTDALCCLKDAWGDAWQSVVKYLTCSTKHLSIAWRKWWCRTLGLEWLDPYLS